ncbi:hypothetical protein A2U01_0051798, partial [Trifolium medium]|nr:hypothetical protein [Trifolium medium]
MGFKVEFHIKGFFIKDPGLCYKGGEKKPVSGLDLDRWSYFEATDHIKGFDSTFDRFGDRVWWKVVDGSLEHDLK